MLIDYESRDELYTVLIPARVISAEFDVLLTEHGIQMVYDADENEFGYIKPSPLIFENICYQTTPYDSILDSPIGYQQHMDLNFRDRSVARLIRKGEMYVFPFVICWSDRAKQPAGHFIMDEVIKIDQKIMTIIQDGLVPFVMEFKLTYM